MDPQALLMEQRRVGDEFRAVEKTVLGLQEFALWIRFDGTNARPSGSDVVLQHF